ncbi:hypothetical protein [Leptospira terpstrae]|uniref:Uncharacterized protein n=1 Tax=Leptospira terpstrae serovar Hualin str. LT 11-33 = ATCC 700639 TaxID=1257025 RepID=N1VTC5_9LEPT|nr:hypothetical protein [Leptospira terpstrae]EMY60222.1 hypothetical protein LEP1GSC203_1090 [Leptospira terpstrae serovar Hualin str. LT 11-33 = ATCC 700639]
MENYTFSNFATAALVFIGFAQFAFLFIQHRHNQIVLIEEFRKQFITTKYNLGVLVFLGRSPNEYYQILPKNEINKLKVLLSKSKMSSPTIWALDSAKSFFPFFSGVCLKILQGQLNIQDIYPLFGTELLRHSLPLKRLLENTRDENFTVSKKHMNIRSEIQAWLVYHEGIRRRSLIMLDLLWAEASRLEDLPPSDLISAADKKLETGRINRVRIFEEARRINRPLIPFKEYLLLDFLRHSEYRKFFFLKGLDRNRLALLDDVWTENLLKKYK